MRWGWCVGCVEGDLSDGEVWKSAGRVISDTKKGDRLLEGYQLTTYQVSGGVITSLDPFLQARPKCFASSLMLVECNGNSPAVSGHTIDYKWGPAIPTKAACCLGLGLHTQIRQFERNKASFYLFHCSSMSFEAIDTIFSVIIEFRCLVML